MSAKRVLAIVGATGTQGGSIIDNVLSSPELNAKYSVRGLTRDPTSERAQALIAKGVEVLKADVDDLESLQSAFAGSWGVFGMTDFWSVMSKAREVEQGKNIFLACKAANVKHLVWSSLPNVAKLSKGKHTLVHQFDGKAEVEEFIESRKLEAGMVVSYFLPAMFTTNVKPTVQNHGQGPVIALPFPDPNIPIPYIDARHDSGKYILGLFEAGSKANGAKVQGVSFWTTPNRLVAELSRHVGKEVKFISLPGHVFASFLPETVRDHVTDMLLWTGEESYYGKESDQKQGESEVFLMKGTSLRDWATCLEESGDWQV
jgi:putative NADH-flavin reductase